MNESRTDDSFQPPWAMKPSTPRETMKAQPIVTSGTRAASGAR